MNTNRFVRTVVAAATLGLAAGTASVLAQGDARRSTPPRGSTTPAEERPVFPVAQPTVPADASRPVPKKPPPSTPKDGKRLAPEGTPGKGRAAVPKPPTEPRAEKPRPTSGAKPAGEVARGTKTAPPPPKTVREDFRAELIEHYNGPKQPLRPAAGDSSRPNGQRFFFRDKHGVTKEAYCYRGKHHRHWSDRRWNSYYGCWLYYCPLTRGYYYWWDAHNCYYPVSCSPGYLPAVGHSPVQFSYYLFLQGRQAGPFDRDALAQLARDGSLTPDTLVRTPGMPAWTTAANVPVLQQFLVVPRAPELPEVPLPVPQPDVNPPPDPNPMPA